MCGISGYLGNAPSGLLHEMTGSLHHRGPDDDGYFIDQESGIGLGFRRLSIIDVSGGHQPMFNETGDIVVVCNGEIYNHGELRRQLEMKGHLFSTRSDTEVLVHGWEEWGIDVLRRVEGMFFVALWDRQKQVLMLARDHMGKKPVHYTYIDGTLYFASEIKAFYHHPQFRPVVKPGCVDDFLSFRYVPGGQIMLENVETLPPAHYLLSGNGKTEVGCYWNTDYGSELSNVSPGDCLEQFSGILQSAVRKRLMSEVPLGLYLSGGLDSSVIAALIADSGVQGLTAFSHGFDNRTDETRYARVVADHVGANLNIVPIVPEDIDHLPTVVREMEMPIGNSDIIGFHSLAQAARAKEITVILSGEGADEIFGSYVHQKTLLRGAGIKALMPAMLRCLAALGVEAAPIGLINALFSYPGNKLDRASLSRLSSYIKTDSAADEYFSLNALFSDDEKRHLLTPDFAGLVGTETPARTDIRRILDSRTASRHKSLIETESRYWLPTYHLLKEDKISMAHSLELRFPFLDKSLVEFCAKLPDNLLRRGSTTKVLLRQAVTDLLPAAIVNRPKGPILVPIEACFGNRFLEIARDILSPDRLVRRGLFQPAYVDHLFKERLNNPFLYDRQLFALLVMEIWYQTFIDGEGMILQ